MLYLLDGWSRYLYISYWWIHAMTIVWPPTDVARLMARGQFGQDHEALFTAATEVLERSPEIYGSALAFEPGSARGAVYVRRGNAGLVRIDYAERGVDYRHQDWFRVPMQSAAPYWSAPYFDAGMGDAWMVTHAVPFVTGDGARGVVTADLAGGSQRIRWHSLWGGASRIIDRDGRYLAWSDAAGPAVDGLATAARRFGIEELDAIRARIHSGEAGLVRLRDPDDGEGRAWLSWALIEGTDWSLMAILDEDRVLANARQQLLRQWLLSVLALLAVLLILLIASRRLTRPLDALRRVAGAVQRGDQSQRVGALQSRDEIAGFAHAFDTMLDALDASQAERLREIGRRRHLEGELSAAREIQRRLLPPPWPAWCREFGATPDCEFHGLCEPATLMSGDFYDVFRLDPERIALLVADVCGKGTPAALYMSIVHTHLRDFARARQSPAATLFEVNRALVAAGHEGMFVTVFLAHYHRSGTLHYACAGHPPPLLARAQGGVASLAVTGELVGAFADSRYQDAELLLEPGDTLLCYTDGVTEAGESGHGLYGTARLEVQLAALAGAPLAHLTVALRDDVLSHCDGRPEDDITLLALRRTA